jgi:serine/threonine-protein kinase
MLGERVGSYRIVSRIGAGGMGAVYLAEHELIGRKAAIKVLLPELAADEESLNRFFNEARATALIRHPGLVDVFDFGKSASGSAYIAMELLEGESLGARLRRDGRLEEPLIVELGRQLASALGAAHERGIVHRDLKPDNVFLVPDKAIPCGLRVKVLDFGIAKLSAEHRPGARKTTTGALIGTPVYMSPEQCRGTGQVGEQSDVYSLGCILYEAALGRPPFLSDGLGELISAHMNDPPAPLRAERPGLSAGFEALVLAMLAKPPEGRPAGMAAVAAALERGRDPGLLPTLPRGTAAPSQPRVAGAGFDTTMRRSAAEVRPGRERKLALGAAGAVLLALGVVGVWFLARGRGERHHAEAPPALDAGSLVAQPPVPRADAAVAQPKKVVLTIDSSPAGAEIYRAFDGIRMGQTPARLELDSAPGDAVFVLRLAGSRDKKVSLRADRDGQLHVELEPVKVKRVEPKAGKPHLGNGTID